MIKNYLALTLSFCLLFSSPLLAQDSNEASMDEKEAMRNQIRKELEDSIQSAESRKIQFTNNDGIKRDKLNISYEVLDIMLGKDSLFTSSAKTIGVSLDIPEADGEIVRKAWSKKIRNKTKYKIQSDSYGISIASTVIDRISSSPINVYSTVNDSDYGVRIVAGFEEDSVIIQDGANNGRFEDVKQFMRDFGVEQYKVAVKGQIKGHNKTMKGMEGDLGKLQKENEKMHKTIKNYELDIINAEKSIDENLLDQDRLILAIQDQKKVIEPLKGDPKKEAEKKLKGIERERKKRQNEHKSIQKKIVKYRAGIEETRREIELNLSEQDLQKEKISRQLSKVKSLEEKLASIK